MDISLGEVLGSIEALQELGKAKLPAKTSYTIMRINTILDKELEAFNAARSKALETHGTLDAEANQYTFTPETGQAFNEEMAALTSTTITIDKDQISICALGTAEITPNALASLSWLIV